jgi:hypothetical protein
MGRARKGEQKRSGLGYSREQARTRINDVY